MKTRQWGIKENNIFVHTYWLGVTLPTDFLENFGRKLVRVLCCVRMDKDSNTQLWDMYKKLHSDTAWTHISVDT